MKARAVTSVILAAVVFTTPRFSDAQPAGQIWRIGFISSLTSATANYQAEGFMRGLRELGYVEGRNIVIEYRWAEGDYNRLPRLVKELVGLNPDLILCGGPPAALAVKAATKTIPVVFIAGNPVGAGIVPGLAKHGGNLTGFDVFAEELDAKRLELLKEALPKAARVALLLNPENPPASQQQNRTVAAAEALGVRPRFIEARRPSDIDTVFAGMARDRPDAVLVLGDPMFNSERGRIAGLSLRIRVPVIHWVRDFTDAGGLMSYGPDLGRCISAPPSTSTRSSKAQSPPTSLLSSRPSSSWQSISRPPERSA